MFGRDYRDAYRRVSEMGNESKKINTDIPDDLHSVVFDFGTGYSKCGFSGEHEPRSCFPSIVGRRKRPGNYIGNSYFEKDWFVGEEAMERRGLINLKYPVEHGFVKNWNDMDRMYHHAFYEQLKVTPEECLVLLTEQPSNSRYNREKMTSMMFDTFNVFAVFMTVQAVLSLYSSGRSTGLVLDSGDGATTCVPVYEGCCLRYAVPRMDIGGRDITDYLVKLLSKRGYDMTTSAQREIVGRIKEKLCYVSHYYDNDLKDSTTTNDEEEYILPDKTKMVIGSERFRAPEILFKPRMIGIETPGVHENLYTSIDFKCPSDSSFRNHMFRNILLSGGSTNFKGFGARLKKEVENIVPYGMKVKVDEGLGNKMYSAWRGGSILTSMSGMKDLWIMRDEYEEYGATITHRKCFTGGGCSVSGKILDYDDVDMRERVAWCCENMGVFSFHFGGEGRGISVSKFLLLVL